MQTVIITITIIMALMLVHTTHQQDNNYNNMIAIPVVFNYDSHANDTTTTTTTTTTMFTTTHAPKPICPQGVACSSGTPCASDGSTIAFEGSALCCPATLTCSDRRSSFLYNYYVVDNNLCACVPLGCPSASSYLVYDDEGEGGSLMKCVEKSSIHYYYDCPLSVISLCQAHGMVLLPDCTCMRPRACAKKQPFNSSSLIEASYTNNNQNKKLKGTWWRSGMLKFTCVFSY